ncbi:MAG TPA: DNA topoisomerase I [Candidatus Syntrophoarchaeum butanivorans]|uniref:DNA topoisomerase 1 n=1 Tax=Candidatus Syntropharchaeum butanivorans TaxID=1839936 RepID=A0A7J2S4R7_9EURY|nr:DNA topoisomerase I [Candidatus Syntrophoarchaeum butanivorans]
MRYIITEKYNTAKRISDILSKGKAKQKRMDGVNVFFLENGSAVIGLSGHIVGVDFPPEYSRWDGVEASSLVDAEVVTIPLNEKVIALLKKIAPTADEVTIATDFDREGELIGLEALRIIRDGNKSVRVNRARYSAITKKEIEDAFSNLVDLDYNLAYSAEARQIIDLIWGASLTRFISLSSNALGSNFLSVGRVQSPTLALLVDREREIEAFIPRPYWEVHARFEGFEAKHAKNRFMDREEVDKVLEKVRGAKEGIITSLIQKTKVDHPPIPFNTTEFLRAASSIGISAANAMRIAESLYVNGFISYPRTDNTVYPGSLDLREVLSLFSEGLFRNEAKDLLSKKELKATRGKKETTDHPPIYPVAYAEKSQMRDDEWKIYELVVRRFFATLADPAEWITMSVKIDISGEIFKVNGAKIRKQGWRAFYPYLKSEERILPELEEGDHLEVLEIFVLDKETKPPSRYGQGRLIKKMEELGLGTKSTRHETISKLYSRAYVVGNPMKPTKKAYAVIDALEKYASMITKPDMTRELEKAMDKIADGKLKKEEVIEESRKILKRIFSDLKKNEGEISTSLREGLRADMVAGSCPECGKDLTIRRSRRGGRFIGCTGYPDCTYSLPLPRTGKIVVTGDVCEKHNLFKLRIINKGKRPWDLGCPACNYIAWKEKGENKDDEEGS